MQRKGQAAMEFLMTYGWAILAAIIAIGVLAYFGVFSPGRLVAGAATITAPFGISAHNVLNTGTTDGTVNLDMIQNAGDNLNPVSITITGTGAMSGVTCTGVPPTLPWNSGVEQTVVLDCTDGAGTDPMIGSEAFTGNIAITYQKQGGGGLNLQASGTIRDTVQ